MEKSIDIRLNKYTSLPASLRLTPTDTIPKTTITVNLASLFHHYYLDSFGRGPPNPDPSQFEHVQFLLPTSDFRFQGNGLGSSRAIRAHRSNELGQAFCRWFLHDHFGITYFAHIEHVLNRQLHRAFGSCNIKRVLPGDTPDYFCARSVTRVCLAEAKGSYSSISFRNKKFASWRDQFDRIAFIGANGIALKLKGHIVATRYATEHSSARLLTTLFAEDPFSVGEQEATEFELTELGSVIRSLHYSKIATKLGSHVLASALATGVAIPNELRIPATIWQVNGPLEGKRFVGGYFAAGDEIAVRQDADGRVTFHPRDPLRLDVTAAVFFGVEEGIFRQLVSSARTPESGRGPIDTFDAITPFYSGFSALRDGSVLAPLDFFTPVERIML